MAAAKAMVHVVEETREGEGSGAAVWEAEGSVEVAQGGGQDEEGRQEA